jgi:hypothetical protein
MPCRGRPENQHLLSLTRSSLCAENRCQWSVLGLRKMPSRPSISTERKNSAYAAAPVSNSLSHTTGVPLAFEPADAHLDRSSVAGEYAIVF